MIVSAPVPSSPVTYDERKGEEYLDIDTGKEPQNDLVCPADIFPFEGAQEIPCTSSFSICHSYQFAFASKEVLQPDNMTIIAEVAASSDAVKEETPSEVFLSFAMTYELDQSLVFTSDDYEYHRMSARYKTSGKHSLSRPSSRGLERLGGVKIEKHYECESGNASGPHLLPFTIQLHDKKEFLRVVDKSGPGKEYMLPVFQTLMPLRVMKKAKLYHSIEEDSRSKASINSAGKRHHVMFKRYDSRLTLGQLSLILGLQNYKLALVKDVETAIVIMFDQLCGFRIGQGTWCRGTPRVKREEMIDRVYEFSRIYFPSFSRDVIQVIIKRGAYSRTQEHLRRERRRKARFHF